jgi:hypothetical protein
MQANAARKISFSEKLLNPGKHARRGHIKPCRTGFAFSNLLAKAGDLAGQWRSRKFLLNLGRAF